MAEHRPKRSTRASDARRAWDDAIDVWDDFQESGNDFARDRVHGTALLREIGPVRGLRVLDVAAVRAGSRAGLPGEAPGRQPSTGLIA